ncbi:MAG: Trigger factor [Candidatus Nomurabacteria bacterium GW2011_GWB1_37_5]|uniref:Trigger factor n=1 Tax=Candidatus Nomurabacteria bacterium GW2011_GWB1_37_5 TaxID=1618742 RepID=A0A0G0GVR3_9BACT|nr:MAG: Trigger factor [Candidatus Nomurabacteria bacterium GW2011_GWB1_37_5]
MINSKINKLGNSEIEIEGSLPYDEFSTYEEKIINEISKDFEMDGFRKGNVPRDIMLKQIPESKILERMADAAIPDIYEKILKEEKIDAIGRPEITITKIAKGNPFEFKIKTAVMPEIKMPDYKKIARDIKAQNHENTEITVTDQEMEQTIMDIRKMRAKNMKQHTCEDENCEHDSKLKETSGVNPGGRTSGRASIDTARHDSAESEDRPLTPEVEEELPEFNDDFVKNLGDFSGVEEFKNKLRENIKLEKQTRARDKKRAQLIEEIIKETEADVPRILIEGELDKMFYRLRADIENAGLKFEDYIKQINKTEADMRKEWENEAIKRAKTGLVMEKIIGLEKIKVDESEIKSEIEKILVVYPNIDPNRARTYVEGVLINEKMFQFLENMQ